MEEPATIMLLPFVLHVHAHNVGWRQEQFFVEIEEQYGETLINKEKPYTLIKPAWSHSEICIVEWGCVELSWEWVEGQLCLHLVDPLQQTTQVKIVRNSWRTWKTGKANAASLFKIQNTCGAWVYPSRMNTKECVSVLIATSALKRKQQERTPHEFKKNGPAKKKRHNMLYNCIQQDSLHALSGTFVVGEESHKVPFRGVRGYENMLKEWLLLSGTYNKQRMLSEGIVCSVYMVILKGNLGFVLNLDAIYNYVMLRICNGGCHPGLSMVRLGEVEVCEVVELQEINWDYVDWKSETHDKVKQGTTSIEISRKGSAVLRIVFHPDTPWDAKAEADVIASCNVLYAGLAKIMQGGGTWW